MKKNYLAIASLLLVIVLGGCIATPQGSTEGGVILPSSEPLLAQTEQNISAVIQAVQNAQPARDITPEFLQWGCQAVSASFVQQLADELLVQPYSDKLFYQLFGQTLFVLYDHYTGAVNSDPYVHIMDTDGEPVTLAFTGDINFADDWETMQVLRGMPDGLDSCLSANLLERMQAADILLVNNEFCYSTRGAPLPGKLYTFRANPENVQLLQAMGADIVSLANNHVYDYGPEAFEDTLATLLGADIPYVGAGKNIQEAMQAQYFIAGGIKIAYVAASRAEKYIMTPEATSSEPGVLRTYDPALFLQAVQTAKQNADVVIAYPHWGTENTHVLEEAQVELGHMLIDAGASLVIGAHPHCLQGLEYYNGAAVAYSLGNFWFNTATGDTALLEVTLQSPEDISLQILPCLQKGGVTTLVSDPAEQLRIFSHLQEISGGAVTIDHTGTVLAA